MNKKVKNNDKSIKEYELIGKKVFKKSIQRCYIVDYENVKWAGLQGIEYLDKHSAVVIFYSKNADKLPLDILQALENSEVKVEHIKVDVGYRNALDFQLVSYLGYIIAIHQKLGMKVKYFMVTKDMGFDSAKSFWRNLGVSIHTINQIERIDIQDEKIKKEESEENKVGVSDKDNISVNNINRTDVSNKGNISVNNIGVDNKKADYNKSKIVFTWNNYKKFWQADTYTEQALRNVIEDSTSGVLSNNKEAIYNMIMHSRRKHEFNNKMQKYFAKRLSSQEIGIFIRKISKYLPY